jgi:hypothetical protein
LAGIRVSERPRLDLRKVTLNNTICDGFTFIKLIRYMFVLNVCADQLFFGSCCRQRQQRDSGDDDDDDDDDNDDDENEEEVIKHYGIKKGNMGN